MKRGFIAGAFDLLHPGHLLTLAEAKDYCDFLVVGLHVDPSKEDKKKHKPIQTVVERAIQLRACKFVNHVIVYETNRDLLNILATQPIDIRFNGGDHKGKTKPSDRDLMCEKRGIEIHYCSRLHDYSTSELRDRIKKAK